MTQQTIVLPRRPRRTWVWVLVAVTVVGALSYGGLRLKGALGSCADGVAKEQDGECVGVTDGGYAFASPGDDLSKRIHAENQRVEKSGENYVTVAFLESMSGGSADRGPEGTRQAIAGAHVAQLELNGERDTLPRIRLLLANTGRDDAYADQVVDQLLARKDKDHLVAVVGIGQSNARTVAAVSTLRDAGVPAVGATVAADAFRSTKTPGFFRVSFPASTQAAAAARYFAQEKRKHHGYRIKVVRDRKRDDDYDTSLFNGFSAAAERLGLTIEEVIPYTSGAAPGQGNALRVVADKICGSGSPPDGVYFAGRGRELRSFIEAAGETRRRCPVTVLSGSSAVGVYFDTTGAARSAELAELGRRWKASGLHAYYTAYTHPRASAQLYGDTEHSPYPDFERRYLDVLGGHPDALDNGQAMTGHDALYATGIAARRALDSYGPSHITATTVLDLLGQTNGTYRVRGVSGPIAFGPDNGEPTGRPMALVELGVPGEDESSYGGEDRGGERYRFVRVVRP